MVANKVLITNPYSLVGFATIKNLFTQHHKHIHVHAALLTSAPKYQKDELESLGAEIVELDAISTPEIQNSLVGMHKVTNPAPNISFSSSLHLAKTLSMPHR